MSQVTGNVNPFSPSPLSILNQTMCGMSFNIVVHVQLRSVHPFSQSAFDDNNEYKFAIPSAVSKNGKIEDEQRATEEDKQKRNFLSLVDGVWRRSCLYLSTSKSNCIPGAAVGFDPVLRHHTIQNDTVSQPVVMLERLNIVAKHNK